jgi:hypothetical protein
VAAEFDVENWADWGPPTWKHQHEHCGVCGACMIFDAQLHRCPQAVRVDILAVFVAETQREYGKPVRPKATRKFLEDSTDGTYSTNSNAAQAE